MVRSMMGLAGALHAWRLPVLFLLFLLAGLPRLQAQSRTVRNAVSEGNAKYLAGDFAGAKAKYQAALDEVTCPVTHEHGATPPDVREDQHPGAVLLARCRHGGRILGRQYRPHRHRTRA